MPTLNTTLTIAYGSLDSTGTAPRRELFNFKIDYTDELCRSITIPPNTVDYEVSLESLGAPKFIFACAELTDLEVTLEGAFTKLSAGSGWLMLVNPMGQPMRMLLVNTPATGTEGRLRIMAFS